MKKSRLLALVPAVALALAAMPLLASPASAATDPVWETGNADKVGTLTFYDASGNVVTSGSTTSRPFVKYLAASQVNTLDTKATMYFAAPDPNLPIGSWATFQSTGSTVYPVTSGPSSITAITNRPVATGGSGDFNLSDFLGSVTLSNAAGYANMVQLRVYTSRPGSFSTTYATADIMISGSTWTQVYPEPAAVTATTTTVAANPAGPVTSGTSVTFTATVSPANMAGSVQFFDGASSLGAGTYTQATGKATLTTSALAVGAHTIKAVFSPTDTTAFSSSQGTVAFSVTGAGATTTTVGASPVGPVAPGTSVTFTATVAPTNIAGSVEFFDGATSLGAGTYTQATGQATFTTTSLASGAHTIKAVFTPTDTGAHSSSQGTVIFTVTAAPGVECSTAPPALYVNNDAFPDMAVGAPYKDVTASGTSRVNAGNVVVMYGDAAGAFTTSGALTQENTSSTSAAGDHFGAALAVGDLNGDSCYELVIGIPGENSAAGRFIVGYGSPTGLTNWTSYNQNSAGVPGDTEPNDQFGAALAIAGSGDGKALWVGAPGESINSETVKSAGVLDQFPAGSGGGKLPTTGIVQWAQGSGSTHAGGSAEAGDRFGAVLSGSPYSLAVGVPNEDAGSVKDAGVVHVFRSGTWSSFQQGTTVGAIKVPGTSEAGDKFGTSVAQLPSCTGVAGDEAIVVGTPGQSSSTMSSFGWAAVVDSPASSTLLLKQGTNGDTEKQEAGDAFGATLAAHGRLVVVGAPTETIGTAAKAGLAYEAVLGCDGMKSTVVKSANQYAGHSSLPGTPASGDRFGSAIRFVQTAVGIDLAIGAPLKADAGTAQAGMLFVLDSVTADGLYATAGSVALRQSLASVAGSAVAGDRFGSAIGG